MVSKADKVKYRRPLNAQQVRVLHALYWYRFCTSKQLAAMLKKDSHKTIQNKLQILEAQNLINKRYDKSYKLAGRSAEYYITPKGARELEKLKPKATNEWATKSLYKNKTVSNDFLLHCITITDTALKLNAIYGDKIQVIPKSYMVQYSTFPAWTPDLYLKLTVRAQDTPQLYFLDVWDGSKPFFVTVRKTRNYVTFKDRGYWEEGADEEDYPYPAVLAICNDQQTQKKLNRQMKRILNDEDDEMLFATTTMQQLDEATKPTEKLWLRIDADDAPEKVSLKGIYL